MSRARIGAVAWLAGAFGLVLVTPPAAAAPKAPSPKVSAEPPGPSRFSAVAGVALNNVDVSVDGREMQTQEDDFSFMLEGGYARRVIGSLFLGALLRADYFRDTWSIRVGEPRFRLDLRAGPEYRVRLLPASPNAPELAVSAGAGPSLAFFVAEDHPVVDEEYGVGTGWNAGLRVFASFLGERGRGPYVGVDVTVFGFGISRHAWVPGDPSLDAESRYRFFGQELFALLGYALAF